MTYPEPPVAGDEIGTMLGSLERQRASLEWKCGGLGAAALRASHPPSEITLGGLLKHLAMVEDVCFQWRFLGRSPGPPWDAVDWDAEEGWEWRSAADDTPEELLTLWQEAVERSRSVAREVLADGDLGQLSPGDWPDGEAPTLRRLLADLIEEYARHVGHADLIRESIDGRLGEDPPGEPVPYAGP